MLPPPAGAVREFELSLRPPDQRVLVQQLLALVLQHEPASAAAARTVRIGMRAPLDEPASRSRRCVETCSASCNRHPNGEQRGRPTCVERRVVLAGR